MAPHRVPSHGIRRRKPWRPVALLPIALAAIGSLFTALLLPAPSLEEPLTGPRWLHELRRAEGTIFRLLQWRARESGGKYPDSLVELAPYLEAGITDTVLARRAWEWRVHWHHTRWLCYGAGLLWVGALALRNHRRLACLLAAAVSVAAAALGVCTAWATACPQPSHSYLARYGILPGLQEPLPPLFPLFWAKPYAARPDSLGYFCATEGSWCFWHPRERCPFDLEYVNETARSPLKDLDAVLARAREGDAKAYLILSLKRETAAAGLFAQMPHDGVPQCLALWGLCLLGDKRLGAAAKRAASSRDPLTAAYAAALLERPSPNGGPK